MLSNPPWKNGASNLIEIQRIETATYSNKAYFPGEHFFIYLRNQCKVDIVFIKSFYLNGKTEFYVIILALLENFFILLSIFFSSKNKTVDSIFIKYFFLSATCNFMYNHIIIHLCCQYIIKSGGP